MFRQGVGDVVVVGGHPAGLLYDGGIQRGEIHVGVYAVDEVRRLLPRVQLEYHVGVVRDIQVALIAPVVDMPCMTADLRPLRHVDVDDALPANLDDLRGKVERGIEFVRRIDCGREVLEHLVDCVRIHPGDAPVVAHAEEDVATVPVAERAHGIVNIPVQLP